MPIQDPTLSGLVSSDTFGENLVKAAPQLIDAGVTSGDVRDIFNGGWVRVSAANTAPTLGANTGLTVAEGGSDTITAAKLDFNDAEQADTAITYIVTTAASNGTLRKNGVAIALNGIFTQDDINNNRITFLHNDSETTSASFGFSVTDGVGGTLTGQTFAITVTAVNDAPILNGLGTPPVAWDQSTRVFASSNSLTANVTANDFSLAGSTTLIGFAAWLTDDAVNDDGIFTSFGGTLSWAIYADVGASPGALLYNGQDNSPQVSDSGEQDAFNSDIFRVGIDFAAPITLTAGTYWLALHEGAWGSASDGSTIWWQYAPRSGGLHQVSTNVVTPTAWASSTSGVDNAFVLLQADSAASVTFVENTVNATPQVIDSDVSFGDSEGNLNGGTLVVSGLLAEDRVAIRNQGAGAGQIGISGSNVTYGGTTIGTFTGGSGGSFTVTLNGNANSTSVDALIQNLTYADVSNTPTATRTLTITATDAGGASGAGSITVNVTAQNDAPTPNHNLGLTLNEGASGTIAAAQLDFDDVDNADTALTYTVTSAATNGALKLSGTTLGVGDTFTQDDINNSRVTYLHDGGETTSGAFGFSVSDGAGGSVIGQTFAFTVTPQNDAPTLGANTGLTLDEGASGTLTATQLDFNDVDNADTAITYTVTSAATNGALKLSGSALGVGGTFTQDDINNNRVTYLHNGGETTSDSFGFSVSDGAGGSVTGQTFALTVSPVNDEPTLTATGLYPGYTGNDPAVDLFSTVTASTVEAGQTFTSLTLTVTNVIDGAGEVLSFDGSSVALTNGNSVTTATNGLGVSVSLSGSTATVSFSGATLDAAALEALVDGLAYQDTSEDPTYAIRLVTITQLVDSGSNAAPNDNVATLALVARVNGDPAVVANSLTLNEGATVTITAAQLDYYPDQVDAGIRYTFLSVLAGTMFKNGVMLTLNDTFTQEDINNGLIAFRHDGGETTSGRFNFRVWDGVGDEDDQKVGQSLNVTVIPQNDAPRIDGLGTVVVDNLAFTPTNRVDVSGRQFAEDFALGEAHDLRNLTVYLTDDSTNNDGIFTSFSGVMSWAIYTGGSLPGTLVASGTDSNVIWSDSGFQSSTNHDIFLADIDFGSAVSLAAGSYWLALHENSWGSTYDGRVVWWESSRAAFDFNLAASTQTTLSPTAWSASGFGLQQTLRLSEASGSVTFAESAVNAAPRIIDGDIAFGDTEGNLSGGTLVVSGLLAEDVVAIRNQGPAAGQIGVSGSNVTFGGTTIGTFTGGVGGNLAVTLNAAATSAAVDALIQNLTYADASDTPTASRTLTITATDGAGASGAGTITINVTAEDDAPVVDLNTGAAGIDDTNFYTEDFSGAGIGVDIAVSDVDSAQLHGATITLTDPATGDQLFATLPLPAGITVDAVNSTDSLLVFVGTASASTYKAALDQVAFRTTSDDPTAGGTDGGRTITVTVNDGTVDSAAATMSLTIFGVNDAPTLTATGQNPTFAENGAAVDLFGTVAASTVEANQTLTSMTLTVTNVTDGASETLTFDGSSVALTDGNSVTTATNGLSVGVSLSGSTATVTFSGASLSAAAVQTLIDSLAYANAGENPTVADRVVTITQLVDSASNVGANHNTATLNIASTVTVSASDDAPVVDLNTGAAGVNDTNFYTEGFSGAGIGVDIAVSDADSAQLHSATVTLTDPATGDQLFASLPLPAGITVDAVNSTDSLLILVGTASASTYKAALDQVGFRSTSDDPTAGGTDGGRTITVVVNDGTVDSATATMNLAIFAVNDAPTLAATGQNPTFAENGAGVDLFGSVTASTVEANQTLTSLTLTVTNVTDGANERLTFDGSSVALTNGNSVTTATNGLSVGVSLSGSTATVTFSGASLSPAAVQTLIDALTYANASDNPTVADRVVTLTQLVDSASNVGANHNTATLNIASTVTVSASDDAPVAVADSTSTDENATINIAVVANDTDIDSGAKAVATIDGVVISSGGTATLASGATVKLESDGTLTYDPNGKFDYLVSAGTSTATNAADTSAIDSFSYGLNGGSTTTVTVTVGGVSSAGDQLRGTSGDETITGTSGGDYFNLSQGGTDTATGGGGSDGFYFSGGLDTTDSIDGGTNPGTDDQVGLQGNFTYTFGANNLLNIETLAIISGHDTRFGNTSGSDYSYDLTTVNANVAAGATLIVNANNLAAGENLTFNGSAETDGKFLFYAGLGIDNLIGGQLNDGFFFGEGGRFSPTDHVDGQGGTDDQLGIRGDYSALTTFSATSMVNVETLALLSAQDSRFAPLGTAYDYNLKLDNANVASGSMLMVTGNNLRADESMAVDGSAETDGWFRFVGGAGDDTLIGGAGDDRFTGGLGKDVMTGNGGADTFYFRTTAESAVGANSDQITDFTVGDHVDLSAIDADTVTSGTQAFTFLDTGAFTNHAGEARITGAGANWTLQVDTDGDGNPDMEIAITTTGGHTPTAADFIL